MLLNKILLSLPGGFSWAVKSRVFTQCCIWFSRNPRQGTGSKALVTSMVISHTFRLKENILLLCSWFIKPFPTFFFNFQKILTRSVFAKGTPLKVCFLFYVYECLIAGMYAHHVHGVHTGQMRLSLMPPRLESWWSWTATWVLGTESGSSARAADALSCWAISPSPHIFFLIQVFKVFYDQTDLLWVVEHMLISMHKVLFSFLNTGKKKYSNIWSYPEVHCVFGFWFSLFRFFRIRLRSQVNLGIWEMTSFRKK